ncbi:MAG: LysR family transcriptional regulator, partial [Billgrantia desiderata]
MSRLLHAQTHAWLKVFAVSARHLSFTRAAEELHVTTGAVSQQIKQLEERLG